MCIGRQRLAGFDLDDAHCCTIVDEHVDALLMWHDGVLRHGHPRTEHLHLDRTRLGDGGAVLGTGRRRRLLRGRRQLFAATTNHFAAR